MLVGGADGNLDAAERSWSEHLLRLRTYGRDDFLGDYYRRVAEDFRQALERQWKQLPSDPVQRNAALFEAIAAANPVLAKLERPVAATLYQSYLRLAEEVAKASGGFLRMGAVSAEESRWMKLPMLTPIHDDEASLYARWEEGEE